MLRIYSRCVTPVLAVLVVGMVTACSTRNTGEPVPSNQSTAAQSSPVPVKKGFEADLDYVRKGQYTYVLVFSRKDGKPLDKDDGANLRTNAPQVVDWVTSEEGKKVIAGTNFDLEKGNLNVLRKRFVVEDYSIK
ncbi:MAG: hypothetical protein ABR501_13280 [Pyrinomonadaceae bacterium]